MNARSLSVLALACFALLVHPLAVVLHRHLYTDGVFFFARLIETAEVSSAGHSPFRFFHHVITQYPMLAALGAGITDASRLSWIYGATLTCAPLLCHVAAGALLLRAGLRLQVVLLVLLYCLLMAFTSFFVISESHLASGLFVLTIVIMSTCDLMRPAALVSLVLLAVPSLACYEFWSMFFPVCLFVLLRRTWRKPGRPSRKGLQVLLVVLYLGGFAFNTWGTVFAEDPLNRDGMISSHLGWIGVVAVIVCAFFAANLLYARRLTERCGATDREPEREPAAAKPPLRLNQRWTLITIGLAFLVLSAGIYVLKLPRPEHAYPLRSLNLLLPLMFASAFPLLRGSAIHSTPPDRIMLAGVMAVLLLTVQAQVLHTARWSAFTKSVVQTAQDHSGYIRVQDVSLDTSFAPDHWTGATLSIVLPALEQRPVRAVFHNPAVEWEPYGPESPERAANLARQLGVAFEVQPPGSR